MATAATSPYLWPHWVKTAGSYSISMAITWKTREVKHQNDLHVVNSMLRGLKLPQAAPGKNPAWDGVKLTAFRSIRGAIEPLRVVGDHAPDFSVASRSARMTNYYLKA